MNRPGKPDTAPAPVERYVIETCIGGFPWKPYAHTDSAEAALNCAAGWAEKGYHARILDGRRKAEFPVWQKFRPCAQAVRNLATGEERAYRAGSDLAVSLAYQHDHPGEEPPPVTQTRMLHLCGDWASYRSDLEPDEIRAYVRELCGKAREGG